MRRRHAVGAALLVLLTACGGDEGDRPASTGSTAPPPSDRPVDVEGLPEAATALVERVEAAGAVAFTAEYEVLARLGARRSRVDVRSAPPASEVQVEDVLVVSGPQPATCALVRETCGGRVEEQQLTPYGITSRFWSSAAAAALASVAGRPDAAEPEAGTRTEAGVALDCLTVAAAGAPPSTFCLTPEGVLGYLETVGARIALRRYEVGPPADPVEPPFPITGER